MHETSKAVQRRLHDSNFITRYFRGNGIDIGAGNDPLGQYIELFPLMESCLSYDREDGDAQDMKGCKEGQFDFVHASHCLEDLHDPLTGLRNWLKILKPGGHLIVTVPDEDMYEQGVFPSTFNSDHKGTFTVFKPNSWSPNSHNLLSMILLLGDVADLIKIEQLTGTHRYGLERQDQTRTPIGESAIEFVIRKRGKSEAKLGDRRLTATQVKLSERRKIALHRPGAIGDIIMTLALVPLLKQKHPDHDIHYFCNATLGTSLQRLMKQAGIDGGFPAEALEQRQRDYEKVINLIGYPLQDGYPYKPMRKHLIQYFAAEMGIDLDCIPHLLLQPSQNLPEVLKLPSRYATIHPQAGWSAYKNWPTERWEEVVAKRPDISFYQIGSATDRKVLNADPTFMGMPLNVSIDLMAGASLHVGVDSWTNHLTNIAWGVRGFTPAIILWGSTQATAAGYPRNTNISLGLECQPCFREDPKISRMPLGPCINPPGQVYEEPKHACMAGITIDNVLLAIEKVWPNG
jgi:ADP-heptose:LPS heptosyltransferase/SAM-dependent methyltransferase